MAKPYPEWAANPGPPDPGFQPRSPRSFPALAGRSGTGHSAARPLLLGLILALALLGLEAAGNACPGCVRNSLASTDVPLDSWIYPALLRLTALGYMRSDIVGLRPWSRMECARLVAEAADRLSGGDVPDTEAASLHAALAAEFAPETAQLEGAGNRELRLESLYGRLTEISGTPLRDGYHFGQTLVNDFGRPYGEGSNWLAGFSARAALGPLAGYARGEYQHAPTTPAAPAPVLEAEAAADHAPADAPTAFSAVNRFRWLDTYVALAVRDWRFSFGKQSLWWGPGTSGPLLWSDNAEPITMLRLTRPHPVRLPGILGWLGAVRAEFFVGRLSDYAWVRPDFSQAARSAFGRPPYIHGEKFSFKPTPNLELGFSRTSLFGGPGLPVTPASFWRSLTMTSNPAGLSDPGDRRSALDATYRLPGLRDKVTVYLDMLSEDEYSPIGYPRRSAVSLGSYLPRLPRLPRWDFRAEGFYTDLPGLRATGYFYANRQYLSGYTNRGNLLGSWVGRQGRGVELWATWWRSPRQQLQLGYRHQGVNRDFLNGGRLDDISAAARLSARRDLELRLRSQFERWSFPLLSGAAKNNFAAAVELRYTPGAGLR